MTRKRMLYVIAVLSVVVGLAWIWSFLSPVFDPGKPKELNLALLIIGALFLRTGWGLFKLSASGLELGFWLWFLSLIGTLLSTAFLLSGKINFAASGSVLALLFLFAWIVLNLFVVIFLGQTETKRLFVSDPAENASASTNVE
jgi:hypothetical protein